MQPTAAMLAAGWWYEPFMDCAMADVGNGTCLTATFDDDDAICLQHVTDDGRFLDGWTCATDADAIERLQRLKTGQ